MKKDVLLLAVISIIVSCQPENKPRIALDRNTDSIPNEKYSKTNLIDTTSVDSMAVGPAVKEYIEKHNKPTYYFIVIKILGHGLGQDGKVSYKVSSVRESLLPLSEDDKYRILDHSIESLNTEMELMQKEIISRKVLTYNSYVEASKAREEIMGINKYTND